MLSAEELVESRKKPALELPSFGFKDFEPNGSDNQLFQIENSLSEIEKVISHERVKMIGSLSQAIWQPELGLAEVVYQVGSHWTTMGHTINQKLYIYPEEALYLLETGNLEIKYNGISLSVQRAYFLLLQNNITIEQYRVYSHLNAHGYKVLRHSNINTVTKYEKQLEIHKLNIKLKDCCTEVKGEKRPQRNDDSEVDSESNKKLKTETKINFPVEYKDGDDINEILRNCQIFQPYVDNTESILNFDYDIYGESSGKQVFKKSCLQLPNYRVIIHRSEDPMPDLKEICRLSKKFKDEVPVIHAIVFPGYIAFYEINPVILPDAFE